MYLYSKSPVKVCHLYLLTAISEILVYAIFTSVALNQVASMVLYTFEDSV